MKLFGGLWNQVRLERFASFIYPVILWMRSSAFLWRPERLVRKLFGIGYLMKLYEGQRGSGRSANGARILAI